MTIEQEVKSALIWKGRDNDPEIDFPREIYDAKLVLDLLIKYNSQISNESEIDGWIDENWDFDTLSHKIDHLLLKNLEGFKRLIHII